MNTRGFVRRPKQMCAFGFRIEFCFATRGGIIKTILSEPREPLSEAFSVSVIRPLSVLQGINFSFLKTAQVKCGKNYVVRVYFPGCAIRSTMVL